MRGLCGNVIPQLCSQPLERLAKLVLTLSIRPYAPERVLVRVLVTAAECEFLPYDTTRELIAYLNKFSITGGEKLLFQVLILRELVPKHHVHLWFRISPIQMLFARV